MSNHLDTNLDIPSSNFIFMSANPFFAAAVVLLEGAGFTVSVVRFNGSCLTFLVRCRSLCVFLDGLKRESSLDF